MTSNYYASKIFPIDETTDFRLVPAVREAFLNNSFEIFQEIKNKILFFPTSSNSFLNIPDDEHMVYWTENHLSGILSTEYLISEYYNEPLNHTRLLDFLKSRIKYGISEFLSVVYNGYTMAALLNLVDFCKNEEIKNLALTLCNTLAYHYAHVVHPYNGTIATACSRTYEYTRYTTDKLKISPLLYLLVGKKELMNSLDTNYTLKYALETTKIYEIPNEILQIVEKRKENGLHEYNLTLTKNKLDLNEEPWILWTYGNYVEPIHIIKILNFFYDNGIYQHHQFKESVEFIFSNIFLRNILKIVILFFYFVFNFIANRFLNSSFLTGCSLHTITLTKNNKNCCIITSLQTQTFGKIAAQQFPCQIHIDNQTCYINYGKVVSGVKKEMSSMSIFPYNELSIIPNNNNTLQLFVDFTTYNPFFYFYSYDDEIIVTNNIENNEFHVTYNIDINKKKVTFSVI